MRRPGRIAGWSRRRGWAAAAVLVLLTNAVLLARVAWNRSGEPAARLDLTERELALPGAWRDEENTGLALTLRFHAPEPWQEPGEEMASWLDREKLGELGFDVGVDPEAPTAERHYRSPLPREVWLVLEDEGEAWRRWLGGREEEVAEVRREVGRGEKGTDDLEAAERSLAADRVEATRLFAIDAGRDRDALRARYADPARFSNPVALGSDGIGANMIDSFRLAYVLQRSVDVTCGPDTAWAWLATGWDLMPDARKDEVTWSYEPMEPWHLAFTAGVRPLEVKVAGDVVFRDGRPTRVDADEIRAKAREEAARLHAKL